MTMIMTMIMTITIVVTTMTDRTQRTKPAVAAKVLVTGASLTSVLAMTAAMGSAAANESPDDLITTVAAVDPVTRPGTIDVAPVPAGIDLEAFAAIPPEFFARAVPKAPVVGSVASPSAPITTPAPTAPVVDTAAPEAPSLGPAPVTAPAPVVAPAPIIVQVPTPAPAPSASTSKSS